MSLGAHRGKDAPDQIELAENIGLENRAQRAARQILDQAGAGEGAIVKQRIQRAAGALKRGFDGHSAAVLGGEVEREALQPRIAQPRAILGAPAGGKYPPAAGVEVMGGVKADAG